LGGDHRPYDWGFAVMQIGFSRIWGRGFALDTFLGITYLAIRFITYLEMACAVISITSLGFIMEVAALGALERAL
jgi:hypothetical protein